jgi:PKD repeat protein
LADGAKYYFVVTAYDTSGQESAYSIEVSKTMSSSPDTTAPVISGGYANNINTSSATINWTTNETSDTQIEYGTTTSYGSTTTLNASLVTTHTQTVSGLSSSTLYHYRVRSRDASGNLAVSGDYTFTTSAPADTTPPNISNIQATNITSSSVTITWITNETSTTQAEYGPTSSYGNLTAYNSSLVTTHSATITGLSSFTTYNFRVRSRDASGNEAISGNNAFKTSNTPPSISLFSASPTAGTTPLLVNFSASTTDQDGYIVSYEWDIDGNGTYEVNTGAVATTSFVYTNAATYNTRARVTDNSGASVVSGIVTITVSSPTNQPPVISSLTANPTSGTVPLTVTFSINASDPDGSIVQYEWDFDGNGTYDAVTTTHPISNTYTNIGAYTAKVRVTDNQGATAIDNAIITVIPPLSSDVQNFTATPGKKEAKLSWINPEDSNFAGVRIRYKTDGKYPIDKNDGTLVGDFTGNKGETKSFLHTDLQNGTMYYYSAVSYDSSGNYTSTVYASAAPTEASISESGGMEEVTVSGGGCFIATAAYGSYLDPHVMVLREFRDRYLLTNMPGKVFVATYYRLSPPVADFIARHETLRMITRFLLTPLIYGVEYTGLSLLFLILIVGGSYVLVMRKKRGYHYHVEHCDSGMR